jgi:hypothetical protein
VDKSLSYANAAHANLLGKLDKQSVVAVWYRNVGGPGH